MNTCPIEILESIVTSIPTINLFNKALIDRTWYKLVRSELYRRWKECAIEYDFHRHKFDEVKNIWWYSSDNDAHEVSRQFHIHMNTSQSKLYEQIEIEAAMLKLGMIVDKEERKIIEYDISEAKWSSDPWRI